MRVGKLYKVVHVEKCTFISSMVYEISMIVLLTTMPTNIGPKLNTGNPMFSAANASVAMPEMVTRTDRHIATIQNMCSFWIAAFATFRSEKNMFYSNST